MRHLRNPNPDPLNVARAQYLDYKLIESFKRDPN